MFFKRKVKKVKNKMAYAQVMAIGFFVIIFPSEIFPQTQYGNSFGHVHFPSASIYASFTTLSSNEWKVIMHSLPFGFNAFIELITVLYSGFSSLFTSILIAWNVFLAGCPPCLKFHWDSFFYYFY